MKKTLAYTAAAQVVLLAIAQGAMANQPAQPEQLEEISVVGSGSMFKFDDKQPFNQAKSATVLKPEELRSQGIEKADTVARYQAGFSNQVFGTDTNTNWYRVRGTVATQAMDGVVMPEQGFFTPQVEMFGVEAVEIVKGADSMTFGATNAGGLINYITKRPEKDQVGKGELTTHFGNKNQRGVGADYTTGLNADNSVRGRLVASYRKADGEWAGTWLENYYIAPSITWDISDKTNLTVLASYLKNVGTPSSNFVNQSGSLVPTDAGSIAHHSNLGDPTQDTERNTVKSIGYEFNHNFGNGLKFSQNYRYQHIDNYHQSAYVNGAIYPAATGWKISPFSSAYGYEIGRGVTLNDGTAKSHTIDNRLTWKWNNEHIHNTLVVGSDYRNQKFNARYGHGGTYSNNANIFNPAASYGGTIDVTSTNIPRTSIKSRQLGFYLLNDTRLWETVGVTLGVRHDRVRNESFSEITPARLAWYPNETDTIGHNRINHTSYSGSVMYFNDLGLNPYYAYNESFRVPDGISGTTYRAYDPTVTKQHEVGVKYMPEWLDGTISLAYFQAKDVGALVSSATGNTQSTSDPIRRKGVEFQVQANLTENLRADVAYTYLHSVRYNADGTKWNMPLIPKHALATRLAYQFTPKFNAGVGVRYTGNSVTGSEDYVLYKNTKVPSATVVDLFASYNITDNLVTRLNINNVGNRKYIAGCDNYCYYAEGISAVANVSYKF